MPREVQVEDQVIDFPDEMSDDDIKSVLREKFPPSSEPELSVPTDIGGSFMFPAPETQWARNPQSLETDTSRPLPQFELQDPGLLSSAAPIAAGLEIGGNSLEKAYRSGLDLVGWYPLLDKVTGSGTKYQDYNKGWMDYFANREAQLQKENVALDQTGFVPEVLQGTARAAVELPAQLLGGAAAATPKAAVIGSSLTAGVLGGLGEYGQERQEGKGRLEAASKGAVSGAITAVTTRAFGATGVESIFKKEGVTGIRNRILEALKQTGYEIADESLDQFQQDLLERVTKNPNKPIEQTVYDVLLAGTIGGVLGGGVSVATQGANVAREAITQGKGQPIIPAETPAAAIDEAAINRGLEDQQKLEQLQNEADANKKKLVDERLKSPTFSPDNLTITVSKDPSVPQAAYIQVDEVTATEGNTVSLNPETLREYGIDVPTSAELLKLPMGQYTIAKAKELLNQKQPTQTPIPESEQATETAAQTEPTKELISMGGELATAQPTGTTLNNETGEQERVGFGLPAAYPTVSRKMLPVWNASAEVLQKDPKAGEKLAAELKINPERGMTDEDSALLLRHKVALENAKNQAAEDSITAGTPEAKQEAMDRFDNISNQLLDLLDAAKFRGSQWGREGRWRQALAFEDYSFESMRRQKRMKADRELTPEEEAETKREYEDIAAKQKSAEAARVKDEQSAREAQAKEVVAETIKTARTRQTRQKAAGVVRDLTAEQAEIVAYLKDHFIENGDLSDTQSSIKKLMELLVEREGITDRLPLETRVHEILSGVDPTLTREGTLDLMSGYGKSKLPSQEPAKKIVRDISQQIISVRKLLDYFKGKRPSLTGMLRDAPSDIQRGWVSMVNEAKKVFKLDVPVDNARSIKSATDAINTRLKNRISDLKQEIATRQKIIRERSPSPYNAETLRLRQELESLQAQHAEIFGSGLTPAQQLDRLEKSAERQIVELERQIKSGEIFPKGRQAVGLTSEKLDAAKAKIEELKLQRQFAREALQPRAEPEVAKNEARISALDKQIAAIEKQLADDAVFSKSKKPRTPSEDARVLEREKKLAELKQERQFARDRNQPGMEPHEQFLLNYLLRVRQREAAYKERLAKGDFEKQVKPKRELSPAVLSALADVEKAKSDFQRGLHQYNLSRRSRIQKIWDAIKDTRNAFVNIISSYDFSAPRQAFGAILSNVSRLVTNPVVGSKLLAIPFQRMFQAWSGEHRSATIDQWIKNRPNATSGADKTAGIQYTDLHSETFSRREENARSVLDDWAKLPLRTGNAAKSTVTLLPKVGAKGVRMSNRAFITYLNTTRALLFDELLRANFQDRAPTEAQLKVLGNIVNLSTGRGALNEGVAKVASEILWAPSLLTSRVQLLTGQPFWGKAGREGGGKARLIVAKEYARLITSGAVLFAISQMFDDKDEDEEPTSSDFGKVVRGNTRIDPWAGFQQVAVLMARLRAGETTSIDGTTRNISKAGQGEVVWNFFKNKARPDLVAVVKAVIATIDLRKDEKDVRVTPAEAAKSAIPAPLAIREVIGVMRDRGMTEGAIVEALALFGAGVSVYEEREAQK